MALIAACVSIDPNTTISTSNLPSASRNSTVERSYTCDGNSFFEVTPANIDESDVVNWYESWEATIDKKSNKYMDKHSILDYFFQFHINPPAALECTIAGDCDLPECDRILKDVHGDKDLARKIFFVRQVWSNIHMIFHCLYVSCKNL